MTAEEKVRQTWLDMLTWEEAVDYCKNRLSLRNRTQLDIARIAIKVCVPAKGGRPQQGQRTYTDFANEINVNRDTLLEWIRIYREVAQKTGLSKKESFTSDDYRAARKTLVNKSLRERHGIEVNNRSLKQILNRAARTKRDSQVYNSSQKALKHMQTMLAHINVQGIKTIDEGVKKELISLSNKLVKILSD